MTRETSSPSQNQTPNSSSEQPAKPKRVRGPNKAKKLDGIVTVRSEAHINHAGIVKLLQAHVGGEVDAETAALMELQVQVPVDSIQSGKHEWISANEANAPRIRFATKGMR